MSNQLMESETTEMLTAMEQMESQLKICEGESKSHPKGYMFFPLVVNRFLVITSALKIAIRWVIALNKENIEIKKRLDALEAKDAPLT